MKYSKLFVSGLILALLLSASLTLSAQAQGGARKPTPFKIKLGQTVTPRAGDLTPVQGVQSHELRAPKDLDESALKFINDPKSRIPQRESAQSAPSAEGINIKNAKNALLRSWHGLDHYDQRFANGGNQFSIEPPDQGLCVGGSFVLETVNTVLQVYDPDGNPLTGVIDINTFFGYPDQFNRTTFKIGPSTGDVSCFFDQETKRWFLLNWTLDVDPDTGGLTGPETLDLAVSRTNDPRGEWAIYRIPSQNDGTNGTPFHSGCPCESDYPHMGMDDYGVYIAVNEYPLVGPGIYGIDFNGAQLYVLPKHALAKGASTINGVLFENLTYNDGVPAYSIHPAWSHAKQYEEANGGTEYLMSTTNTLTRFDNRVAVWAVTNTSSLETNNPAPMLYQTIFEGKTYGDPNFLSQRPGDLPLRDCLDIDCFGYGEPPEPLELGPINGNDSGMKQVYFANGKLYASTGTILSVNGQDVGAVIYWIVQPQPLTRAGLNAQLLKDAYVSVVGNNLVFPAIAVNGVGKGVIGFTLVGPDYYPSAAYVELDQNGNFNAVSIAALGVGPQDGFSEYSTVPAFVGGRPRWGDYSAAVSAGKSIWFATEYINQTCTFEEYLLDTTCGGTRSALANWGTRVVQVKP